MILDGDLHWLSDGRLFFVDAFSDIARFKSFVTAAFLDARCLERLQCGDFVVHSSISFST